MMRHAPSESYEFLLVNEKTRPCIVEGTYSIEAPRTKSTGDFRLSVLTLPDIAVAVLQLCKLHLQDATGSVVLSRQLPVLDDNWNPTGSLKISWRLHARGSQRNTSDSSFFP
jgi:hypothetical protein